MQIKDLQQHERTRQHKAVPEAQVDRPGMHQYHTKHSGGLAKKLCRATSCIILLVLRPILPGNHVEARVLTVPLAAKTERYRAKGTERV
jgi:hypothetical protein